MTDFKPTQWSTVKDKEKFARQFLKFVRGGFKFTDFPKWFYQRLSQCFMFIAHYDQHGFYSTYFETASGKLNFLRRVLEYPCYGDPTYTYSDVEKWLQTQVTAMGLYQQLLDDKKEQQQRKEQAQLQHLLEKYGVPMDAGTIVSLQPSMTEGSLVQGSLF